MKIYPNLETYPDLQATFFKLSDEEILSLKKESISFLKKIENNSNELESQRLNHKLAGHIEHQYILNNSVNQYIESIMKPVVKKYIDSYMSDTFLSLDNLTMSTGNIPCWINLQKKNEFNPMHKHHGMLSFVIWLQVPFSIENEQKHSNIINGKKPLNGNFCFIGFNNKNIYHIPLNVDHEWEGRGVLFSSELYHSVYPFYTSDDYRISISSNYKIK